MKKVVSLLVAIALTLSFCVVSFADEVDYTTTLSYDLSKSTLAKAIDYLNEVYLDENISLAFDTDYMSLADREMLTNFVNTIIDEDDTDLDKANKIYDWVINNISLSYPKNISSPIGMLLSKQGLCTGFAQITSAMFKVANIPCAICRGQKEDTTICTLNMTFDTDCNHEWVMAYVNGNWALYDAVWNNCGIIDTDYIAKWYFIEQVGMVTPYNDNDLTLAIWDKSLNLYYINGEHKSLTFNNRVLGNSSSVNVGSGIRYIRRLIDKKNMTTYFYTKSNNTFSGRAIGDVWQSGLYSNNSAKILNQSNYFYVLENGIEVIDTTKIVDDNYYLFLNGEGTQVTEEVMYHSIQDRALVLHKNETISGILFFFKDAMENPDNTFSYSSSNEDILTVDENGNIFATGVGSATITCQKNNYYVKSIDFKVVSCNDCPFANYCNHTFTYNVDNEIHCHYCGTLVDIQEVKEEIVMETPVEEVDIINEEEVKVTETDEVVITETDIEEVTNTDLVVTETNIETDTQEEEVTETDIEVIEEEIITNTDTDLVTETNVEEEVITETDLEVVTNTDTDIVEEIITETNTDIEVVVETETDTQETITETDLVEEIVVETNTDTDLVVEETNTNTNLEEVVVEVTETNIEEVITETNVIAEITETNFEEVTDTDLVIVTETNVEITETDIEEVVTDTNVVEEIITETNFVEEEIITETDLEVVTETNTDEVTDTNLVVTTTDTNVEIVEEEIVTDTDLEIVTETDTNTFTLALTPVTQKVEEKPVVVSSGRSGGSGGGSGSAKKVVEEVKTIVEEVKQEVVTEQEKPVEEVVVVTKEVAEEKSQNVSSVVRETKSTRNEVETTNNNVVEETSVINSITETFEQLFVSLNNILAKIKLFNLFK